MTLNRNGTEIEKDTYANENFLPPMSEQERDSLGKLMFDQDLKYKKIIDTQRFIGEQKKTPFISHNDIFFLRGSAA